jgi:energy-coupling factor transporter ATP-binding protein EcfA2
MLVINLFGEPGSGKSTLAQLIAGVLKTQYPQFVSECPNEFAKGLVYEEALKAFSKAQFFVTASQFWTIAKCEGHADIVVCDSPVLLGSIYGEYCDPKMPWRAFRELCRFHHDRFPSRNYIVQRSHTFEEKARLHSEKEADIIEREISAMLMSERINAPRVKSSYAFAEQIAADAISTLPPKT